MTRAAWELQKAVQQALIASADITDALGGPWIFDHVPHGTKMPYVAHAGSSERDWSTGTETGSEHLFGVAIWSDGRGRRQLHVVASAVRAALHLAPLQLSGHRLVLLRHLSTDTERRDDGESLRAVVRFRALTEPAD